MNRIFGILTFACKLMLSFAIKWWMIRKKIFKKSKQQNKTTYQKCPFWTLVNKPTHVFCVWFQTFTTDKWRRICLFTPFILCVRLILYFRDIPCHCLLFRYSHPYQVDFLISWCTYKYICIFHVRESGLLFLLRRLVPLKLKFSNFWFF